MTVFKHKEFRSRQREIILSLLGRNDGFVLMPTGITIVDFF